MPEPKNPRLEAALDYARRGWLCFPVHYPVKQGNRYVCSCGKDDCNPAKHPLTKHGYKDATTDQQQLRAWWLKHPHANVGIATGEVSGLVVIDIDPRHGGTESMKAITKLGNIPITPQAFTGGGGEHIYLAHPGNGTRIKSTAQVAGYPGVDIKADGGAIIAPPSRHISGGKYSWKRHHLQNKLAAMPEWISDLIATHRQSPQGIASSYNNIFITSSGESLYPPTFCDAQGFLDLPEGVRDYTLFEIAAALKRGGMPKGKVEQIVATIGEKACQKKFTVKESLRKVESAFDDERNYSAEIKELVASQKRNITVTYIDKELHYVTQRHKASRRMVIHRLIEAGILEHTQRAGEYRIIEQGKGWMNLVDDDATDFVPIKFPFGIENLVDIPPKGIICCAGTKDSGKTVYALNTVAMNMNHLPIYYFSSEMGEFALKQRLKKFDWPLDTWKFKAKEVSKNFADEIVPDGFNIIDYLEITDKFWLVAEEIRSIFDKLTTGVAFICLQKDKGQAMARGKFFSIEKAHLYMSLEVGDRSAYNTLTIISGKFWHQEAVNPRGIDIKYKIINGSKLIEMEA